ncbi:MAG TPA: trypsin-like peptidase domain-containing protein, partial [Beijerinckia sp.]|nr:trypsin-like peptidase domain-containing protein [Beijerinckia sp.]
MREDLSKRERRIILFATVSGLAIAALVAEPSLRSARFVDFISPAHSAAAAPSDVQGPSGFADIVEKVKPAVVSVRVKMAESAQAQRHEDEDWSPLPGLPLERFFRRFGIPHVPHFRYSITGQGSGFFISADGYAVTNYHVVDKAKTVEVVTDDGSIHTAKVIGTDPQTDVALIKVDSRSDFPYVVFADKAPRVGDWVLAVGNPFGLGGTVTAGIVSASGRNIDKDPYDDFIQIDAPINKGNSGGP